MKNMKMDYRNKSYETYSSVLGLNRPMRSKYESLACNLTRHLKFKGDLLDIGSGQGELLELCRRLGLKAEGIDISSELVEHCQQRGLNVTMIDDLLGFLNTCPRKYAYVTMIDVLEHFTKGEAIEIVTQIRKHTLQPGGTFIAQVPNMQSPFAALNMYHDITHEWAYTESSLGQLLKLAGFFRIEFFPQRYPSNGIYLFRQWLRETLYFCFRIALLIDQPNRGRILTPNLIVVAQSEETRE